MNAPPAITKPEQKEGGPILQITDLTVHYATESGPLKALRNIDITVNANSITGIVGESGCGKSTLISAIIRLLANNASLISGAIELCGDDLLLKTSPEMRELRGRDLAVVFQEPMQTLNPVLTIGRQMTDIQYRSTEPMSQKRQSAEDMLTLLGIPDARRRLRQYPFEFSGGMLQRVAIAMALMARPKLLIADEPTTALDATLEVEIINRIKTLQKELGCAVLFISHHLGVIAELCDHVAVMYAGEIVERGSVRDLFHTPQHPYTKALIACDPGGIKEKTRYLPTIPGDIPDLGMIIAGCIYQDRCGHTKPICRTTRPPAFNRNDNHTSWCHLPRLEGGS